MAREFTKLAARIGGLGPFSALEIENVVHLPEFTLEPGRLRRPSAINGMGVLRHWVLAENDRELLAIILFQIAQRRPKNEAGHAFEVPKFFQGHGSFWIAAHMRRLRARLRG